MKLVRFGPPGRERPGVWLPEGLLDIRAQAFDIEDFDAHFFARAGVERVRALTRERGRKIIPATGVRLGPPIPPAGKIICLGKNYADHAAEFDSEIPKRPLLFGKAASSVIGPHDPIRIPPGAARVDAEAELAVVIGAGGRIAGYTALNDVTDRDAQRDDRQWFRAKSLDTFCPLGPWWVTADEIPDPQALRVRSRLNGQPLQDGNTRDMIFPIAFLLDYIGRQIRLDPGDLISTGTPSGVGFARTPPALLRAGDVIEIEIEGVGALKNPVLASE